MTANWPSYGHTPAGFLVTCTEHDLARTVETEAHARNLVALHLRVDHPASPRAVDTYAISGAAEFVVLIDEDPLMSISAKAAALGVFSVLVGMPTTDALAYAHAVIGGNLRATPIPF